MRLVGGRSQCAGAMELKNEGVWRQVGAYGFKVLHSSIVCRQLNCGNVVSSNWSDVNGPNNLWFILLSDCDGSESSLRECVASMYERSSGSRVELVCSGNKLT